MYKRQFLLLFLFFSCISVTSNPMWYPTVPEAVTEAYDAIKEAIEHDKNIKVSLACLYSIGTFLLLQKTMNTVIPAVVNGHPTISHIGPLSGAIGLGLTVYKKPSFFVKATAVGVAGVGLTSCILGYNALPALGKWIF